MNKNIVTLNPGLIEAGKIKIGRKGEKRKSAGGSDFQLPQKTDHFTITTLERDETGNFVKDTEIHKLLKNPAKLRRIPIMLMFDDIESSFQSRFAQYKGTECICSGDGEKAMCNGKEIDCSCGKQAPDYQEKDKCKMSGTLSVMIRNVNKFGSCWKFRTTSFNSVQGIYSSLHLIRSMTGGLLAGLDLELVLSPKTAVNPANKKNVTIYVVGVEFAGTMQELRDAGVEVLKLSSEQRQQMKLLESDAVNLLEEPPDPDDEIEEFYPEQVDGFKEPVIAEDGAKIDTDSGEVLEEAKGDVQDSLDDCSVDLTAEEAVEEMTEEEVEVPKVDATPPNPPKTDSDMPRLF